MFGFGQGIIYTETLILYHHSEISLSQFIVKDANDRLSSPT